MAIKTFWNYQSAYPWSQTENGLLTDQSRLWLQTLYRMVMNLSTSGGTFTAAGDLSGTNTNQTVVGLQNHAISTTAPANGQVLTWSATGSDWVPQTPAAGGAVNPVIGFVITSGTTGTNIGPMLAAARSGALAQCLVTVKASDAATALTFQIKKNGTALFGTPPTVAAGAVSGSQSTFAVAVTVAANDVFSIDITSGSSNWQFTAQLE